jgi:radical SAM superfamily enzyme YgiQ (UPF0313 family)
MNVTCVYIRADKSALRTETMPLGIACISAVLKSIGCDTDMLYINAKSDIAELISAQKPRDPKIFAISAAAWDSLLLLGKLTAEIKKQFPKALVIVGGTWVTLETEQFLDKKFYIDALCIGEGETAMKKYVLMAKQGVFEQTDNLWIKTASGWLKCDKSVFEENLDAVPFADRTAFDKWIHHTTVHSVYITKGCPNRCIYCLNPVFKKTAQGKFVRYRSPKNIVEEIKQIQKHYPQANKIMLNCDSLSDKNYLISLCKALEEYKNISGAQISFMLRINFSPALLDEKDDIAGLIKRAGISNMQLGFESASPEIRKQIKRPHYTNEQIIEFVRRLRVNGIAVEVYAMYCHPFETKASYAQTLENLKAMKADVLRYQYMIPLHKTEAEAYVKSLGKKYKKVNLVDIFRIHTACFRVYISYKPFFESLMLAITERESGDGMGVGLKTPFVNLLKKFIWQQTQSKEKFMKLGKEAFDKKDYQQAVKYLGKVRVSQDNLWVKGDIALAQMQLGDYKKAADTLQKALALDLPAAEAENFKKLQNECLSKLN